jgi:muramoyltetrapeptide carboxypeptidase
MPHLDADLLHQSSKLLIGFSDLTILLNTIAKNLNTVTIHGPVLTTLSSLDKESLDKFFALVTGEYAGKHSFHNMEVVRGGIATGTLRGGNLTTISHLLGTPWEIPLADSVLFIEDTGEPMYKIDRMLTQLALCGHLQKISGLLIGCFDYGTDVNTNIRLQEDISNRVLELTGDSTFPIWGNLPIGHLGKNHALPIGMRATQDSSSCNLYIGDA